MKVLIFFILALGVVGCKETHCPAFPEYFLKYFPYERGDLIRFSNLNNDTLYLIVNNNWVSDSYSFDWNCKCSCGAEAGFDTDIESILSIRINGNINVGETSVELICNFYNSEINNDVLSYYQEGINPYSKEIYSLISDTITINKQECHRIEKVKIIKDKGIVEFWDKEQNCNWVKVERNKTQ